MASVRADTDDRGSRFTSMVDLLLTVSYIDGVFHHRERAFIQQYMDSVAAMIEQSAPKAIELRTAWRTQAETSFRRLEAEIALLAREVIAVGDDTYVGSRLRVRAVTLFRSLATTDQATALELVTALVHVDGKVTTNERNLRDELLGLFSASPVRPPVASPNERTLLGANRPTGRLVVSPPAPKDLVALSHPLLDPVEQTLSPHPIERMAQVQWDFQLVQRAMQQWERLRATGTNRLNGITDIAQLPAGSQFLDRHIYVMRPTAPVELVVLGDLHGCYSCLKAALLQSNFIQRAWAHQWDPQRHPDVKLVLLGDYIDRGRYSFDGVLRAVLQLFIALPDYVIVLRGNHEDLRWHGGRLASHVYPAEALASIQGYVAPEMLEAYRLLFETMPTSLIFERTLFVHAGIPRDDTFAERYRDLASLDDDQLRYQMMWSDPIASDHVPVELQRMNPRFSFGRDQFKAFMQRANLHSMIRGHEQIERGFEVFFDLGDHVLLNLFSSGGADNADLPIDSSYRAVTPMALSVHAAAGALSAVPWPLHYQPFNYAPHNGLYRAQPVLEYRYA